MSTISTEHVLVVPTEVFHKVGHFQGFCTEPQRYLAELLQPRWMSYRPRSEMEKDPSFKQLIPYVIFRYRNRDEMPQLFNYTRGKGQGEARLHQKRSVGIGGHISADDAASVGHADVYAEGMRRELEEEVLIDTAYRSACVGLINDDLTEVGTVHLGIVHVFDVEQPRVRSREEDIVQACFLPVAQLLEQREQFETWSQICLDALFG